MARTMEQTPGVGVARIDSGDELGGGRSSAIVEVIENGGKTHGAGLLEHLRDELKLLQASDGPTGHRRVTGDELQRRSSSGSGETRPRARKRDGKMGEITPELTVVTRGCSGCSRRHWIRRIDGGLPAVEA